MFYANFHLQFGLFIGGNHSQILLRNYLIENQGGERKKEQQDWWFKLCFAFCTLRKGFFNVFFLPCTKRGRNIYFLTIIRPFTTSLSGLPDTSRRASAETVQINGECM